jgi:predicted 3-demethylubiquinone-9 3-methyltransferase (glyoxalase superfamily)
MGMPKITPHLWFDQEARKAAEFYTSVFPDSRIKDEQKLARVTAAFLQMKKFDIAALQRAFEGD